MSLKKEKLRDELLDKIAALIKEKLPEEQAKLASQFLRQYYATVAIDDLLARNIMDLYGAMISHWQLMYVRKPGEVNIRIYNPHFEQHGWQSTHTVIEIAVDDMPFIVDSIVMELNRRELTTHMMFHTGSFNVMRDKDHKIVKILPVGAKQKNMRSGAPIYIEVDRLTDQKTLDDLQKSILNILEDVSYCVADWQQMITKTQDVIEALKQTPPPIPPCDNKDIEESITFLKWMLNDHFTFLGYREYQVSDKAGETVLSNIPNTGLGVLRDGGKTKVSRLYAHLNKAALKLVMSPNALLITKTNTKSTVHRPAYTDMISIKKFDDKGNVVGEKRIVGLFTSVAYNSRPYQIPLLRHKVSEVMEMSNLSQRGHAGKALLNILETLPRDDLFQSGTSVGELLDLGMSILHLQERKQIRMFIKEDVFRRYASFLVFVPRDRFNTELRLQMQKILMEAYAGTEVTFQTLFTDSTLARIHFMMRLDPNNLQDIDPREIEQKLIEVGRLWVDDLKENLIETYGEELGNVYINKYSKAFPAGYREALGSQRTAVSDIGHFESLESDDDLQMNLFSAIDDPEGTLRFKLYRINKPMPLSDALPILENMGLRVVGEQPYKLRLNKGNEAWINDFSMSYQGKNKFIVDSTREKFQKTFANVWFGHAENDSFNQLTLLAKLDWREISVLRAYAKYFKQINFTFSQSYIEETLCNYPEVITNLIQLFLWRFDPSLDEGRVNKVESLESDIMGQLDAITNLDQDRILRQYLEIIKATIRTNYFQLTSDGKPKDYMSFKLDPSKVPYLPLPAPMFEVFVYSPWVEGVHLRSGKVARGGLRWSDRREDFRTEVLGLMKAQRVKNSVIVPYGAKGGFIPKQLPVTKNRDEILKEAVRSYKMFIQGLLDITDNMDGGNVVHPENVVRYDGDDPYLVVAADKGTATFSDYANSVSQEYGFWLGDAFASGGKTGYDHKKMGITAKGAWESVKRHFRELGVNTQEDPFTVVGIGDMAGDVFGNGMLLSDKIKLVGAFNHLHIFVDPDPCPKTSFEERQRLFDLPRSGWDDYNSKLISKGGGIFNRLVKAIKLTPEMKKLLVTKKDYMEPNELIRSLLKSPVDLLWNGGIGTFVKAKGERHEDVGDRANDNIRVNGDELRCKIIGEGGNLGCTQLGRIEYALDGGKVYTDFIDNSAGVDCSDHEVNIKILLNEIVTAGDMTEKQRNELLASMTDDVSNLVLPNNYAQTQAISIATNQAERTIGIYARVISDMEAEGNLVRDIEFLPSDQELFERKSMKKGLTAPEISVVVSYSKILLKEDILKSDIPEDPYISEAVLVCFPERLIKKFKKQIYQHSLSREIIATVVSNNFINRMGVIFLKRLNEQTGADSCMILRAYSVAQELFNYRELMSHVQKLDYSVPSDVQYDMLLAFARFMRRVTRWFLRHHRNFADIQEIINQYNEGIKKVVKIMPQLMQGTAKENYDASMKKYTDHGVPDFLANLAALSGSLFSVMDIISCSSKHGFELNQVASVYTSLAHRLDLAWFKARINEQPVDSHWDLLAKAALRDDIDNSHYQMTINVLHLATQGQEADACIDTWLELHSPLVERWRRMVSDIRGNISVEFAMFSVAVRELQDLVQSTGDCLDDNIQRVDVKKKREKAQVTNNRG